MKKNKSIGESDALQRAKLRSAVVQEKRRCQAAVQSNERLRAKLETYRRQALALRTALSAVESMQRGADAGLALRVEMGAGRQLRSSQAQVFDMLESRFGSRLHELDLGFEAMQEAAVVTDADILEKQCRRGDQGVGAVEFSIAELLPFDKESISTMIWSFIKRGIFLDGELGFVRRRSDDAFVLLFRVTVQLDHGAVATIDTHSVMKRFMTHRGFAVMTEACSCWTVNCPNEKTWTHST
ncbi:unnamed protein product [Phytophthora fragariaefolia]|uniref:Unnamed protein product n=1 Tax=Phytophthora fragariaefolia TaxID=1490495 RepID=A0A9W6Y0I3_9STRA|nr:unnamed protein product [Phytophthora fragariaefolia]